MLVHLPTPEELAAHTALLHDVREELRLMRELLARPADEELTLDEVAARTKHTVKTVRKWINEGKYTAGGDLIKLHTVEYAPGFLRVPLAALVAYGHSLGFEVSQLPTASNPIRRKPAGLDSAAVLRKAS